MYHPHYWYPQRYRYYGYPVPYGYVPYGYPYYSSANILNSQLASVNQSMFNAGVMTGVAQTATAYNIGLNRWP